MCGGRRKSSIENFLLLFASLTLFPSYPYFAHFISHFLSRLLSFVIAKVWMDDFAIKQRLNGTDIDENDATLREQTARWKNIAGKIWFGCRIPHSTPAHTTSYMQLYPQTHPFNTFYWHYYMHILSTHPLALLMTLSYSSPTLWLPLHHLHHHLLLLLLLLLLHDNHFSSP